MRFTGIGGRRLSGWMLATGLAAFVLAGGCSPVSKTESAVLLAITADAALVAGSITVDLIDDTATMDSQNFGDLMGWPSSPRTHTVLIIADTEPRAERLVTVTVYACAGTGGCGSGDSVASAAVAGGITFIGGQVLQERSVTLN